MINDVQTQHYDAASAVFGRIHNDVSAVLTTLNRSLAQTGAMAGSDPVGMVWAGQYDPAAHAAAGAIGDLASATLKLAAMLERSGFNHGVAEWASDPTKAVLAPADTVHYDTPADLSCYESLPTARGGSSAPPHGWGQVEARVGYLWPNGHPDTLRAATRAWVTAADAIDGQGGLISEALVSILEQRSPEVHDAWTACNSMGQHLNDTATTCRSLATACQDLADHIEYAHAQIKQQLVDFLRDTAIIEGAGGLFAVITAGVSELLAQGGETAEIITTAGLIGNTINKLLAAARMIAEALREATTTIAATARRLKVIANARLSELTGLALSSDLELAGDAGALMRLSDAAKTDARITRADSQGDRNGSRIGKMTKHGADRIAGKGATRGGCLTEDEVLRTRAAGIVYKQPGGVTVHVLEEKGRFLVVLDADRDGRYITSFGPLSPKALDNRIRNKGWYR